MIRSPNPPGRVSCRSSGIEWEASCTSIRTLGGPCVITVVDAPVVCIKALVTSSEKDQHDVVNVAAPPPVQLVSEGVAARGHRRRDADVDVAHVVGH